MKRLPKDKLQIIFMDMVLNLALLGWLLVNPSMSEASSKPIADFVLRVVWPLGRDTDIDVYVKGPSKQVVWYSAKDAGPFSIDRDDLGARRDSGPINQEIVSFRSPPNGSYYVSVHNYREGEPSSEGIVALELEGRDGRKLWHKEVEIPVYNQEIAVAEFLFSEQKFVKAYPSAEKLRHGALR